MHICYLDESGTPQDAGTSHFVLLGLAIPARAWKKRDREVAEIKRKHRVTDIEIHTGYLLRKYPEQERISGFAALSDGDRRTAMQRERKADLAKASVGGSKQVKGLSKTYRHTAAYVHLTHAERRALVQEVATAIGGWEDVVLFADAVQKSASHETTRFEYAFEQVVTRFHHYLMEIGPDDFGMLVQDNNETAAAHLTALMRAFHRDGTAWSRIPRIIETPLFVDSQLTSMVQLADLCSYAVRRFFENSETALLDAIYPRFHRKAAGKPKLVGLRHYTGKSPCSCRVCNDHGRGGAPASGRNTALRGSSKG